MILIVVGMPGSGKDIFVQEAARAGFDHIRMGDMVRLFAGESNIEFNDQSIGGFATEQRREYGPDIWARRTLERMPEGDVLIDGSRSLHEIEYFRKELGDEIKVIAIRAPEDIRFGRLVSRGREDDPSRIEEFRNRDQRELSWGLGQAIEGADIAIDNDGTLEEFRSKCMQVLGSV